MEQGSRTDSTSAHKAPMSGPGPGVMEAAIEAVLSRPADAEAIPTVSTTPEADCPAFKVGAQIGRLVAIHSAIDVADTEDSGPERADRRRAMERCDASIILLRQAMTWQFATSAGGALAQVIVAAQALSDIVEDEDASRDDIEDYVAQARRCLYSISPVLSKLSGVSPRALGSDYLMARHIDHFRNAWSEPPATYVVEGPKPTIEAGSAGLPAFVEAQLIERNRIADEWWGIDNAAGNKRDEANEAKPKNKAMEAMADLAGAHALRVSRENLARAMNLPATTVRELGLQARLVAVEVSEWWDDNNVPEGEMALRTLLDRLMGLAGVAPIKRRDIEPAEAREWLAEPDVHAPIYHPEMRGAQS